jgi:hypothetical protein
MEQQRLVHRQNYRALEDQHSDLQEQMLQLTGILDQKTRDDALVRRLVLKLFGKQWAFHYKLRKFHLCVCNLIRQLLNMPSRTKQQLKDLTQSAKLKAAYTDAVESESHLGLVRQSEVVVWGGKNEWLHTQKRIKNSVLLQELHQVRAVFECLIQTQKKRADYWKTTALAFQQHNGELYTRTQTQQQQLVEQATELQLLRQQLQNKQAIQVCELVPTLAESNDVDSADPRGNASALYTARKAMRLENTRLVLQLVQAQTALQKQPSSSSSSSSPQHMPTQARSTPLSTRRLGWLPGCSQPLRISKHPPLPHRVVRKRKSQQNQRPQQLAHKHPIRVQAGSALHVRAPSHRRPVRPFSAAAGRSAAAAAAAAPPTVVNRRPTSAYKDHAIAMQQVKRAAEDAYSSAQSAPQQSLEYYLGLTSSLPQRRRPTSAALRRTPRKQQSKQQQQRRRKPRRPRSAARKRKQQGQSQGKHATTTLLYIPSKSPPVLAANAATATTTTTTAEADLCRPVSLETALANEPAPLNCDCG